MLSLQQLRTPPSRTSIVTWSIERLRQLGFQTTGWQEGGIEHSIIDAVATVVSGVLVLAASISRNVYSESASGAALELLSRNRFDNEKTPAENAEGDMTFANAGTVAHVVKVGAIVVENGSKIQFTNTEAGTIPAGGAIDLGMRAVLKGASGNVANNSTWNLVTPLAGVTVTNPGPGDVDLDGFADPWYATKTGSDASTDLKLRQLNASKWGLLSFEQTSTAYLHLALRQDGVAKAKIVDDNPRGAGTIDVYIAAEDALLGTSEKEAAQANFALYKAGTESVWPPTNSPLQSVVEIKDPDTLELDIQGTIFYDPQYTLAQMETAVSTALSDFVKLMGIGGIEYISGSGTVALGDISELLEAIPGVRNATLTVPTGNIPLDQITMLTSPSDWITGKLTFTAVTS
jgi:hypothetical protein